MEARVRKRRAMRAGSSSRVKEDRVQAQLKIAETSQARLEAAVANADAEVDNLRAKMEQRRAQMDAQPAETPKPRKP